MALPAPGAPPCDPRSEPRARPRSAQDGPLFDRAAVLSVARSIDIGSRRGDLRTCRGWRAAPAKGSWGAKAAVSTWAEGRAGVRWEVENDDREARPAAGPRPASPLTCSCHVGKGGNAKRARQPPAWWPWGSSTAGAGKSACGARSPRAKSKRRGLSSSLQTCRQPLQVVGVIAHRWRRSPRTNLRLGLPMPQQLSQSSTYNSRSKGIAKSRRASGQGVRTWAPP